MTTPTLSEMIALPCREAFENWYAKPGSPSIERSGEGYRLMHAQMAWTVWQGAWLIRADTAALQAEVERLRDALEFYANGDYTATQETYWDHNTAPPTLQMKLGMTLGDVVKDKGEIARKALSPSTEGEKI